LNQKKNSEKRRSVSLRFKQEKNNSIIVLSINSLEYNSLNLFYGH